MSENLRQAEKSENWNSRSALVCFAALAVSLPMAWVSLSKFALFFGGLVFLLSSLVKLSSVSNTRLPGFAWLILCAVTLFALSIFWTEVSIEFALQALVKHAKLITVLLILYLLRNATEVDRALRFFIGGQAFVLVCSWMLAAGISLPWIAANNAENVVVKNVVFAQSYLDQSIMLTCSAAVIWHLASKNWAFILFRFVFVAAAIASVVFLLPGRTGHLIVASLIALTLFWAIPTRKRWGAAALLAFMLGLGASFAPSGAEEKLRALAHQGVGQRTDAVVQSSNEWRLNAWKLSLEAMAATPWMGTGVGSWSPTVKKLQGADADLVFGPSQASNPHQEFLLWGVSLGVPGMILLVALFTLMTRQALQFEQPARRAALSVLLATAIACGLNSALFDDLLGDYLCVTLGLVMAYGRFRKT